MSTEPRAALRDALAAPARSNPVRLLSLVDPQPDRLAQRIAQVRELLAAEYSAVPLAVVDLAATPTLEAFVQALAEDLDRWFGHELDLPRFDLAWAALAKRGIAPAPPESTGPPSIRRLFRWLEQHLLGPLRRLLSADLAAADRHPLERLAPAQLRLELLWRLSGDLAAALPQRPGFALRAVVLLSGCEEAFGGLGSELVTADHTGFERFLYDELDPALAAADIALVLATRRGVTPRLPLLLDRSGHAAHREFATEQTVDDCRQRAQALDEATDPAAWATAQHELGDALQMSVPAEPESRLAAWEEAVACYEAALRVRTREATPREWGQTHSSLGAALANLAGNGHAEHADAAVEHLELALAELERQRPSHPAEWLMVARNLLYALGQGPGRSRPERVTRAVALADSILRRDEAGDVTGRAEVQRQLGEALLRVRGDDRRESVQRAVEAFRQALGAVDQRTDPLTWADRSRRLSRAWLAVEGPQRDDALRSAIDCLDGACRIYRRLRRRELLAAAMLQLATVHGAQPIATRGGGSRRAGGIYAELLAGSSADLPAGLRADLLRLAALSLLGPGPGDRTALVAQALSLAQEAVSLAETEPLHPLHLAWSHYVCAEAWRLLPGKGRPAHRLQATAHLDAIEPYFDSVGDNGLRAAVLVVRAHGAAHLPGPDLCGELRTALAWLEEATRLATADGATGSVIDARSLHSQILATLPMGSKTSNVGLSIASAEEALSLAEQSGRADAVTSAHYYLGCALARRPDGDRVAHLARAIACLERAADGWPADAAPLMLAEVQVELGAAWAKRSDGDRHANLDTARAYQQAAIAAFAVGRSPFNLAAAELALGRTLARSGALGDALGLFDRAAAVLTRDEAPVAWASAQHDLGNACTALGQFERAVACYETALRVRTPEWAPHDWAETQVSLGLCYVAQPGGDREASLLWAIECFEAASMVFTLEDMPHAHGTTQSHLARAWLELGNAERAAQCRSAAVAGFEAAGWVEEAAAVREP